jgi:hypothetical protein
MWSLFEEKYRVSKDEKYIKCNNHGVSLDCSSSITISSPNENNCDFSYDSNMILGL